MPPVGPRPRTGPACGRPDLARRLPDWDALALEELALLEAHARDCPRCGPELDLLRQADTWLAEHAPRDAGGPCPEPELLYAALGGPGAEPLPASERSGVEEHLSRCRECAGLAATLPSRPPSPLVLDPEPPAPALRAVPRVGRPRRLRLVAALAAAAALVATVGLWWSASQQGPHASGPVASATPRFPQPELLRGDLSGPLLFPRSSVLVRADGSPLQPLLFELEPQPDAASYRLTLARRENPSILSELGGTTPSLTWDLPGLAPGAYTWEAWAVVHGLDVPLGRRDFEARHDEGTLAELAELDALSEPARSEQALALLVERGYLADARAWARSLPASPERDAFLARPPGR